MRRMLIVAAMTVAGVALSAGAEYIDIPVTTKSTDLSHGSTYAWGIDVGSFVDGKGSIQSVELIITGLNNNPEPDASDVLNISLLDITNTGTLPIGKAIARGAVYAVNQTEVVAAGDFFSDHTQIISTNSKGQVTIKTAWDERSYVGSYTDDNWYYTTTGTQTKPTKGSKAVTNPTYDYSTFLDVATITDYISGDGYLGLGLDPDCHYSTSRITLRVKVPEPSSLALLFTGLLALSGYAGTRRRK